MILRSPTENENLTYATGFCHSVCSRPYPTFPRRGGRLPSAPPLADCVAIGERIKNVCADFVQIPLSKPKQREFWDSTFDFTPKVSSDFHHASKFGIATQPLDGEDTGGVKGARSVFQRSRGSAKLILDKGLNEHLISSIKTAKARNDKQYHRACTAEQKETNRNERQNGS